jgi:hypothetical protein
LSSRIQKLAEKGPEIVKIGENQYSNSVLNVPVFGSQAGRFNQKIHDLPPPGAYDVSEAFNSLKAKGMEGSGILASQCKRYLFRCIYRLI